MTRLMDNFVESSVIKVIGVGGCGGNSVTYMINSMVEGVEFICANTDIQALKTTSARKIIQLGKHITKGLGAGANPEIGKKSALEDRDILKELLFGTDILFIIAGMGGGTGTGAAPIIAEISKDLGVLTIAIVTRPFLIEGIKRNSVADDGISSLRGIVDSLIIIPNEKLLKNLNSSVSLLDAFKVSNNILLNTVKSISDLIVKPGLINVDFADIRTVMYGMGIGIIGTGCANGNDRAKVATMLALNSDLFDDMETVNAKGVLVNITSGIDISITEFEDICCLVKEYITNVSIVIIGSVIDINYESTIKVTLIVTGLNDNLVYKKKIDFIRKINILEGNVNLIVN